ncbi:MAG TPA: hypothetical protein PLO37_03890 [Candidatus Hydrogenedentes bacterium]|nr:hypothetical protein [Candidatus Hydrogenedentota bacterium]HPG65964.1 hypothetical protein [Candidatus Hydrogenedentota bacterium]
MSMLATWLCAATAAALTIDVAPDQPLPLVYVDEPLVIEFMATESMELHGHVAIAAPAQETPASIALKATTLRPNAPYWCVVDGAPNTRGFYTAEIHVDDAGAEIVETHAFCRVDRPPLDCDQPVAVHVESPDALLLLALQGVAVDRVRVDGEGPDLADRVDHLLDSGFRVTVRVAAASVTADDLLPEPMADRLSGWEMVPSEKAETLVAAAATLKKSTPNAPIAFVVSDTAQVSALLAAGAGRVAGEMVVKVDVGTPLDQASFQRAAEEAGYERLPVSLSLVSGEGDAAHAPIDFLPTALLGLSVGVRRIEVPASIILDQTLTPSFVSLGALGYRLSRASPVGALDLASPQYGPVFRVGSRWIVALWTTDESDSVRVAVGEASDLALADAYNNPLPMPEVLDGAVHLALSGVPVFLSGQGGPVILDAAWTEARKQAHALCAQDADHEFLAQEVFDVAESIHSTKSPEYDRLAFFKLVQALRDTEAAWHEGRIARARAVPMLAALSRLARRLCTVEQERDEPFIEPFQDTLARCREHQSLYLTGAHASSGVQERGDWLLGEVDRLISEAEALMRDGRAIEADAVAAVARWRARALDCAAQAAPLSAPEVERDPSKTEEDGQAKAPKK